MVKSVLVGVALIWVLSGCGATPTTSSSLSADACGADQALLTVAQSHMEPTFLPGDILVVEGGLAGLQRGSIFAIDWQKWTADLGPNAPERVIGMPGDHVQLQNGRVVLNGAPLGESFGPTEPVPDGPSEWVVPPGQVFVLADGRPNAADSRVYGFVPFAALIGRVSFRCAPDDRRGPIAHLDGMTFANAD